MWVIYRSKLSHTQMKDERERERERETERRAQRAQTDWSTREKGGRYIKAQRTLGWKNTENKIKKHCRKWHLCIHSAALLLIKWVAFQKWKIEVLSQIQATELRRTFDSRSLEHGILTCCESRWSLLSSCNCESTFNASPWRRKLPLVSVDAGKRGSLVQWRAANMGKLNM